MWVKYSGRDEDCPYSWDPDVMGERQLSRLQNFCTIVHGQLVHYPWNIEVTKATSVDVKWPPMWNNAIVDDNPSYSVDCGGMANMV